VLALPLRRRHRRSFLDRSWRVVPSRLISVDKRNPRRCLSPVAWRDSAFVDQRTTASGRNGRKWRSARRGERKSCSQEWLEATTTGGRALLTKSSRRSHLSASPLPPRRARSSSISTLPHPPAAPSESIPAHPRSPSHVRTERTRAPRYSFPFAASAAATLPSESPRETPVPAPLLPRSRDH
jgi:hypothetical protein